MKMNANALESALQGLEAGFKVLHIATLSLMSCDVEDNVDSVLAEPSLIEFDHIPVRRNGLIVGVLDRQSVRSGGEAGKVMKEIASSVLVSAEAPLRSFIPVVSRSPYWLIVRVGGIEGIVTRSDLLKLPVRLHAFTLVTHLESVMAEIIAKRSVPEDWLDLLDGTVRKKISARRRRLKEKRMDPPLLELTDFGDKAVIVADLLALGGDFSTELEGIRQLRNSVAHAGTFANDSTQVEAFVGRMLAAGRWIADLRQHLEPD